MSVPFLGMLATNKSWWTVRVAWETSSDGARSTALHGFTVDVLGVLVLKYCYNTSRWLSSLVFLQFRPFLLE
jgi:hypothetical protein